MQEEKPFVFDAETTFTTHFNIEAVNKRSFEGYKTLFDMYMHDHYKLIEYMQSGDATLRPNILALKMGQKFQEKIVECIEADANPAVEAYGIGLNEGSGQATRQIIKILREAIKKDVIRDDDNRLEGILAEILRQRTEKDEEVFAGMGLQVFTATPEELAEAKKELDEKKKKKEKKDEE